jgi:hypothetical protein
MNGDFVPLRKIFMRYLSFSLRFQEYGMRTTTLHPGLAQNIPPVVVELKLDLFLLEETIRHFSQGPNWDPKAS